MRLVCSTSSHQQIGVGLSSTAVARGMGGLAMLSPARRPQRAGPGTGRGLTADML